MQLTTPVLGHFYQALYYEYELDKDLHNTDEVDANGYRKYPIEFRYKQQDASRQGVGFVGDEIKTFQGLSRVQSTSKQFRLVTNDDLPFKPKDRIVRVIDEKRYTIRRVIKDKTVTNSILALQFPNANYYQPTVIEISGS